MRDIFTVIKALRTIVPEDQTEIVEGLKRVERDAPYKAPEIRHFCFGEIGMLFERTLPKLTEDWQFFAVAVFMDIPVSKVREQFA